MKASELRIGNIIKDDRKAKEWRFVTHRVISDLASNPDVDLYHAIPLTEEWLIKWGFEVIEHLVTGPNYQIPIGRDRFISVSGLGGGNEFVFLSDERGGSVNDVVVLRNFDYDGRTYVHHMQNLFHALTGKELTIKE